jgi:hypothetical protein
LEGNKKLGSLEKSAAVKLLANTKMKGLLLLLSGGKEEKAKCEIGTNFFAWQISFLLCWQRC